MGLLDFDQMAVNPLVQMGLGILANSTGPRGVGLGATLGRGALQGMEGVYQTQQMQNAAAFRKMQMDEMQRQQQQAQSIRELAGRSVLSPQQQAIGQYGPTPQGAAAIPNMKPKFDTEGFLGGMMGIDPLQAMQLRQSMKPTPIKLGEGDTLLDPTTYKPLAKGAPKADAVPSAIKEYQFAVGQGYKGSFEQWDTQRKAASRPVTNVNTFNPKELVKIEQDFRKEFEGIDPVKNYRAAYPAYAAVVDAAGRDNPQSDINLVYGIAKLYDPTSVVREGEYATISNSQAIPEWLKGLAQNVTQGKGKLTAETKARLVQEANSRIKTYEDQYRGVRTQYDDIAKRSQLDPRNVFTPIGRFDALGQMVGAPSKASSMSSGGWSASVVK